MPIKQFELCGATYYGATQKGEHPQDACFRAAGDDSFFVVYEKTPNNRVYATYPSAEVFYEHYKNFSGPRCFFQLNRSVDLGHPSKLYLDIEWITSHADPTAEKRLVTIIGIFQAKLKTTLYVQETLTRRTENGIKNSFHLYFPVLFKNNRLIKDFIENEILPHLAPINEMWESGDFIVDLSVYSSNRAFRLPGSSKAKGYVPLALPSKESFLDMIISQPIKPTDRLFEYQVPDVVIKKTKRGNKRAECKTTPNPDDAQLQALIRLLRELGDNTTTVYPEGQWYIGRTDRKEGRTCLIAGEHNKSDNCVLIVRQNGDVYYHCHDAVAHKPFAGKKIGSLAGDYVQFTDGLAKNSTIGGLFTGSLPQSDLWAPGISIENHDDHECRKINPREGTRCYAICAPMALGKTLTSIKFIDQIPSEASVLIVSTRIAFSNAQMGNYKGFRHYKDRDKKKSPVWDAQRLIIQYESLFHLYGKQPFDYVILDETRSLMSNMTCDSTNKGIRLRLNSSLLQLFVQTATLLICLDADLEFDKSVPIFLESCFRTNEIEVHRYSHRALIRTITAGTSSIKFEGAMRSALACGERIAILCRTKKNAQIYQNMFHDCFIKIVTSDTPDEEIRELSDINRYLQGCQLLIMTSKITVGSDVRTPFDRVFVDFRGDGCLARDMLQMMGRFRNLTNTEIAMLVTNSCHYKRNLEDRIFQHLTSRKKMIDTFAHLLPGELTYVKGKMTFAPDWFTKLYVLAEAERDQCQEYLLFACATAKGWPVWLNLEKESDISEEAKQSKEEITEEELKLREEIFEELKPLDKPSLLQQIENSEQAIERQESSKRSRTVASIAHVLKHYPPSSLSFDEFEYAAAHRQQISVFAMLLPESKFNHSDLVQKELEKLPKIPFFDISGKMLALQIQKISEVLGFFGVALEGFGAVLDIKIFASRAKDIKKLMTECASAGARRLPKEKPDDSALAAASALRRELEHVWGTTLKQQRRNTRTGHVVLGYIYHKKPLLEKLSRIGDFVPYLLRMHDFHQNLSSERLDVEQNLRPPGPLEPHELVANFEQCL